MFNNSCFKIQNRQFKFFITSLVCLMAASNSFRTLTYSANIVIGVGITFIDVKPVFPSITVCNLQNLTLVSSIPWLKG